jgi:hypothetical protein
MPKFGRARRLPVSTDRPDGPPPFLLRYGKWFGGGIFRRRDRWVSAVQGGLNGFNWRTELDAYRDGKRGVPDGTWGAILPHAVTGVRETAEAEMAAIGVAWQHERPKYDSLIAQRNQRVGGSRRALERAKADEERMEHELFVGPHPDAKADEQAGSGAPPNGRKGSSADTERQPAYPGYIAYLDREFRDEYFTRGVTKDDYLRIYDTRYSTRTIGYWAIIAALTVAEFPLNEKVFTQLGDTGLAYIIAAGLGVTLITAAHFVGVTFRRYADIRAARHAAFLEIEHHLAELDPQSEEAKPWERRLERYVNPASRTHRGVLDRLRGLFVSRPLKSDEVKCEEFRLRDAERTAHLRSSGKVAAFITALVIISAIFLGYARAGLVENQQQSQAQTAGVDALLLCQQDNQTNGGTQDCQAAQRQAVSQAQAKQISQPRALSTIQYGILQILIFFVAAALTFSYYNEVVAALRQARARLGYLRRCRMRAERRHARYEERLKKAVLVRWARYDLRHDQAETTARYYRSVMDNYYEVNLQTRSDAADQGAEISAQPRPSFRYPAWMFEDLSIPEEALDTKLPTKTRHPGFRRVQTTNGTGQQQREPPATARDPNDG